MARKVGYNWRVKIATDAVVGIGTVSFDGMSTEEIDVTAFGDTWKQFDFGLKDGGTLTFDGNFDPADNTGQQKLTEAALFNSQITTLRVYIDNTSYYVPCQTTGYFSPYCTTGAPTVPSYVMVKPPKISADQSGTGKISFEAKISGCMVLI